MAANEKAAPAASTKKSRTPSNDVEITIPIAAEIREAAALAGVSDKKVRELVVPVATAAAIASVKGKVKDLLRAEITKRLGVQG